MSTWSKRFKSTKLEMKSREVKYPLQTCSDPKYSTVGPWWKMRHIKAEIKMIPNRRFLAGTLESSNGWWRIRLLRRKNLTAEKAGDIFPLYPWNFLSFSIITYSFTLFSEWTLHLLALIKTWMFHEDPVSLVGLYSGRFFFPLTSLI